MKPIKQSTMYYLPRSSELVVSGSPPHHRRHWHSPLFWHHCFEALVTPKDIRLGDEHARLAPTMDDILGYPENLTPEQAKKAESLLADWATHVPGIGPVSKAGTASPGRPQNRELVRSTQTTEAIVKASKRKGVTVTSFLHAAYIQAITKYADRNLNLSQYVTVNEFNLRPYLPGPYNTSQYAAANYFSPLPLRLDLPSSLWDTANAFNRYYQDLFQGRPGKHPAGAAL